MNKIWIASVVVFFVALVGCKKDPVILKSPEFVQAVAIPAIVEYNGTSILNYEVINAEYVQINHVKYDSCKGSVEFKNLTASTTITIVAFGEGTTSTTKSIDIAVGNPQAPTIKVTAPTDSIPYGDKAVLSWTKEGVISSITIDGITQTSDSFTTLALYESKEYTIVAKGPGGSETQKIIVLVGKYIPTRTDTICSRPMHYKSWELFDKNGNLLWSMILDEEDLGYSFYYFPNGDATRVKADGTLSGAGKWKWGTLPNTIDLGGTISKYKLTDEYFITYLLFDNGNTQVQTFWY